MIKKWTIAIGFLAIIAAVIVLSQVGGMTRFEHRTLRCHNPLIGPFEIVLGKSKIGETLHLAQPQGDSLITIIDATDTQIIAANDELTFMMDHKDAQVQVLRKSRISRSKCEKTEFAM